MRREGAGKGELQGWTGERMKGGGDGDREEEVKGCGSKRVVRLEERTTGWIRGGRRVLRGGTGKGGRKEGVKQEVFLQPS